MPSGDGWFNVTKEALKTELRTLIPEGTVSGNWRAQISDYARNLPFISVRFSPVRLSDVYDRDVGDPTTDGSIADYSVSIHIFHSNCMSEPTCEKGKYAQDVASRIISGLLAEPSPVGFDIFGLQARESEPARGGRRISRVIIEGNIHIKRID